MTLDGEPRGERSRFSRGVALGLAIVVVALSLLHFDKALSPAPGVYWLKDACTKTPVSGTGVPIQWCVPSVAIDGTGTMEVRVSWNSDYATGFEWGPFDNDRNFYLLDAWGRRLDHVSTSRGASFGGRFSESDKQIDGGFVFPLPRLPGSALTLVDASHGRRIHGIKLRPASHTSIAHSNSLLAGLRLAERVSIVVSAERWAPTLEGIEPTGIISKLELSRSGDPFVGRLSQRAGPAEGRGNWRLRSGPPMEVSAEIMRDFFDSLVRVPLLNRKYEPKPAHYKIREPSRMIFIETDASMFTFYTDSHEPWNVPWAAIIDGRTFTIPDESVARALVRLSESIDPELASSWTRVPGPSPLAVPGTNLEAERELRLALQRGDRETLERLLKSGTDPNGRFLWDGETPVTVATLAGHADLVRLLVAKGGDTSAATPRFNALAIAARRNDLDTARVLLEAGADHRVEEDGWTPVGIAAEKGHDKMVSLLTSGRNGLPIGRHDRALLYLSERGSTELVGRLLAGGTTPGSGKIDLPWPPLQQALANGHRDVARLLITAGADLEATGWWGAPALFIAVSRNDIASLEMLLDAGALVDERNARSTPLMSAVSPEAVRLLVEAGADVNARDGSNRTVLMRVAASPCGPGSRQAAQAEATRARLEAQGVVEGIVAGTCFGLDPDTPGAVALLLEYGVDPAAKGRGRQTALDLAAADGQSKVVAILREAMARQAEASR